MKLKVLVDNNTYIDQYYYGEPAVCYYIEDNGIKMLFDVGYSGLFIKNAKAFQLDLSTLSKIAISHGHDDHTRGLKYFNEQFDLTNINIVAHPHAFKQKVLDGLPIGSPFLEAQLKDLCQLTLTKVPIKLSENLVFLGEIPAFYDFEARIAIGKQTDETGTEEDYVCDDSALVYQSSQGLFVITGCSHSGICNIIEYAKQVCKEDKILGVIGGFHLFDRNSRLDETIQYFVNNNITELYPCHCVSFQAKAEINKYIPVHEVGVGMELELDEKPK